MLILVVMGIKLAHVDMALKGKKTTSHLLFNISLLSSQPFFRLQVQCVFTAVYVLLLPGGPHSHGSLLCQELCTCLGRKTYREGFKICGQNRKRKHFFTSQSEGLAQGCRGLNSGGTWLWSPVLLCGELCLVVGLAA